MATLVQIGKFVVNVDKVQHLRVGTKKDFDGVEQPAVYFDFGTAGVTEHWDLIIDGDQATRFIDWLERKADVYVA